MNRTLVYRASCILVSCWLGSGAWALEAGTGVRAVQLVKSGSSWDGQPVVYPAGKAEITALTVEVAPGAETGWHVHAVPSFALMLDGELEISLADGRSRRVKAGDALVEVVNTRHNGRNPGKVPAKLVVFYAGAAGVPHTMKRP